MSCTLYYRRFLTSPSWDGSQTARSCWHRGLLHRAKKSLWAISILGGNARQLSDEGWSASVSPDSSQIVFLKGAEFGGDSGQEIWLMQANGSDQRKLMSFPEGGFALPVWSPDGRWIAYVKFKPGPNSYEFGSNFSTWSRVLRKLCCRTHIWKCGGSSGCRMDVWSMPWMNHRPANTARTFGQPA